MSETSRAYFERYEIARIDLEMQPGVVDSADRVCNLTMEFTPGYRAQFKLQGEQALLGNTVRSFLPNGVVELQADAPQADHERLYQAFFRGIENRLEKIQHELAEGNTSAE